jgi:putative membrane protein
MAEIPIQRKEGRNIWPILIGLLLLLGILWWLFGRNRNDTVAAVDTTAATTTASNGMAGDSAAMAGGATGADSAKGMNGNSPVPASAKKMTDAEIFSMIGAVNQGEIDAGKLAQSKATNASVKSYASEMVAAHTKMTAQNGALASALGAIPKPDARDSIVMGNTDAAAKLKAASGAAFDQTYVESQIAGHTRTLAFLRQAQGQAQNADLKKMIDAAIPDVQKHLDQARSLQK